MEFGFLESYSGDAIKITNNNGKTLYFPYFELNGLNFEVSTPSSESTSDGSYKTGKQSINQREFQLKGAIRKSSQEKIIADRDELINFLRYSPLKIYPKGQDRYINAHMQNYEPEWTGRKYALKLNFSMSALDPFFYSDETVQENIVLLDINNSFERIIELQNNGNIESYPAIQLTITENSSNSLEIKNTDTGSFINFDTELVAGDVITIDCEQMIVQINGNSTLDIVNDVFLLHSFFLISGTNNIKFSSKTGIKFDSEITYQSRWL